MIVIIIKKKTLLVLDIHLMCVVDTQAGTSPVATATFEVQGVPKVSLHLVVGSPRIRDVHQIQEEIKNLRKASLQKKVRYFFTVPGSSRDVSDDIRSLDPDRGGR